MSTMRRSQMALVWKRCQQSSDRGTAEPRSPAAVETLQPHVDAVGKIMDSGPSARKAATATDA